MIHYLGKNSSLLKQYIAEVRDMEIQKDSLRFRRNLERLGEIFAYEISKQLKWAQRETITSLGTAQCEMLAEQPVIATILRAGLPVHQGILNYFDRAENAFISAYRKHHKNGRFDIQIEYTSCPNLDAKQLIISDPMLATGASMVLSYKELLRHGKPAHTHIVSILASAQGVEYVKRHLPPADYTLWLGEVDDELTAKAYIVPGLGDAGDLAFGSKL
ncbi:MAG: uracil phosphoribosyltransferase [Bacteroidales bacterium]|jgi:uracil phosphoribosyltransferase|nr:uracil phosphoribosyltransferase [Bacteroidales bacterium]